MHLKTTWTSDSELVSIPNKLDSSCFHWQTDVSAGEISSCGVSLKTRWWWKLWRWAQHNEGCRLCVCDWRAGWQKNKSQSGTKQTSEVSTGSQSVWTSVNVKKDTSWKSKNSCRVARPRLQIIFRSDAACVHFSLFLSNQDHFFPLMTQVLIL